MFAFISEGFIVLGERGRLLQLYEQSASYPRPLFSWPPCLLLGWFKLTILLTVARCVQSYTPDEGGRDASDVHTCTDR